MTFQKLTRTGFFLALTMFLSGGSAQAFEIAAVGQLEVTDPKFEPGVTGSTKSITPGGGLLFSHYIKSVVGLEVGALLTGYKLRVDNAPAFFEQSVRYFQFPIMLRIAPDPAFSFGVGYYLATSTSSTVSATSSNGTTETTLEGTLPDRAQSDHGIVFGGSARIPISKSNKRVTFILDGRFLIGRHNLSANPAQVTRYNHIQMLAGVSFKIGKSSAK